MDESVWKAVCEMNDRAGVYEIFLDRPVRGSESIPQY